VPPRTLCSLRCVVGSRRPRYPRAEDSAAGARTLRMRDVPRMRGAGACAWGPDEGRLSGRVLRILRAV